MKNKKIFKLIFAIMLTIININTTYAVRIGYGSTADGSNSRPSEDELIPLTFPYTANNGLEYSCEYKYYYDTSTVINIEARDLNKNPIFDGESLIQKNNIKIKAGTYIYVNITETKKASWEFTEFKCYKKVRKYYCNKYEEETKSGTRNYPCKNFCSIYGFRNYETVDSYNGMYYCKCTKTTLKRKIVEISSEKPSDKDCPSGYRLGNPVIEDGENIRAPEIEEEARTKKELEISNEALGYVNKGTTNKIMLLDTNKYSEKIKDATKDDLVAHKKYENPKGSFEQKYYQQDWYIEPNEICIDLKTAKIKYKDCNYSSKDTKILPIYIGGIKYWQYFIPLDTKTDEKFYLSLEKGESPSSELSEKECTNVVKNHRYINWPKNNLKVKYTDLLTVKTGGMERELETEWEKAITQIEGYFKNSEDVKCYLTTKVYFPIVQKFYNEEQDEDNKLKFKGFNFYYKPIDITNPFPNGVSNNSLWKEWYNQNYTSEGYSKNEKNPNISNSYSKESYIAKVRDIGDIRGYNNNYTSWDNMAKDGTSDFVNDYIDRKINKVDSILPLGTGPGVCIKDDKITTEGCDPS